jgi:SAM-dependent methyltransferase
MTNINLKSISDNLDPGDGIWTAKSRSKISFPAEGHQMCLRIEENSFWFRHRNDCIIEVAKQFPPGGTLFDVGGGNGFVSMALEKNGLETVMVEPGEEGVWNARERGLKNIIYAAFDDAGFKPGTLPSVGLFDVCEHIREDGEFLKSIFKSLRPEGKIYITVPAFNFLWSNEDEYAGHFRRYTIKSMSEILYDTGFFVEYATYIFSILPVPVFLSRTLPGKFGLGGKPLRGDRYKSEHAQSKGIIGKLLKKIWGMELNRIRRKKPILFGGSVLIVAKKKNCTDGA